MIDTFLFDLYGTLVDIKTEEGSDAFWEEVSPLFCLPPEAARKAYFATCAQFSDPEREFDLLEVFSVLCPAPPMQVAERFRAASLHKLRLYDGAEELLCGLRTRGAKLYLLSNAQACFTRAELAKLGLVSRFDGILLSSEIGFKKPARQFFEAAFRKFSLSPAQCLYVGNDRRDDVMGAHRAGMPCAYMQTEQSGHYEEGERAETEAQSMEELTRALFGIAEGEKT